MVYIDCSIILSSRPAERIGVSTILVHRSFNPAMDGFPLPQGLAGFFDSFTARSATPLIGIDPVFRVYSGARLAAKGMNGSCRVAEAVF